MAEPFFTRTKRQDRELWEAFAVNGHGDDFVDGNTVIIPTRAEAEELLRNVLKDGLDDRDTLVQILRQEILKTHYLGGTLIKHGRYEP
jgi:hypothetical protein